MAPRGGEKAKGSETTKACGLRTGEGQTQGLRPEGRVE